MIIKSKLRDYKIVFENRINFVEELLERDNSLIVVDSNVYDLYAELFKGINDNRIIIIEATEQNKVIDTALNICDRLTEIPAKRNATLISLGGGIIQDITGFVANITYRGIDWIYIPTTLLAACDSCIGGKTSLNYKHYKNLIGTFYPPSEIHICSSFFKTLSERDYKSGLGEVIKFNIMKGEEGLESMEADVKKLLNRDRDTILQYVNTSLEFKKKYIEIDEFDKGERIKLNFAHTFGHAIEVISKYDIPHGTAVAIGMIMANHISMTRGILREHFAKRSERVLLDVIDVDASTIDRPVDEYIDAIRKDKKQISENLTAVLICENNNVLNLEIVRDISSEEIAETIEYFKSLYMNIDRE